MVRQALPKTFTVRLVLLQQPTAINVVPSLLCSDVVESLAFKVSHGRFLERTTGVDLPQSIGNSVGFLLVALLEGDAVRIRASHIKRNERLGRIDKQWRN